MKVISTVALVTTVVSAVSAAPLAESHYQSLFTTFVEKFDKNYETAAFFERYSVFKSNVDYILSHNKKTDKTFTLSMNTFGDMNSKEFAKRMGLTQVPKALKSSADAMALPEKFVDNRHLMNSHADDNEDDEDDEDDEDTYNDWKSYMSEVVNNGTCGAGWAFAATAGLEGIYAIKNSAKIKLAEQQLLDCDPQSEGCSSGLINWSYDYLKRVGGQCVTKDYPYAERQQSTCYDASCAKHAVVKAYSKPLMSDEVLFQALKQQPIPISIAAGSKDFQFYSSGVLTGDSCSLNQDVNHAVVAVGYGKSIDGIPYYLLRNSWGKTWGLQGHLKVARGQNNDRAPADGVCSIFQQPWSSYPTLA